MLPRGIYLLTSRDLMTPHPIMIKQDSDLSEAAKLMVRHNISGLPAVEESGKLVGVITKSDVIRAIASNN
jgi:CBS domain-containing protein